MSKKLEVKLNYAGVGALLKSAEMQDVLIRCASTVQKRAGDNFEVWNAPTRAVVQVRAKNEQGDQENLNNNKLLKALGK